MQIGTNLTGDYAQLHYTVVKMQNKKNVPSTVTTELQLTATLLIYQTMRGQQQSSTQNIGLSKEYVFLFSIAKFRWLERTEFWPISPNFWMNFGI